MSKALFNLSGYRDSNPGPPTPEAGALTGLRYTPNNFECQEILVGVPGFEPGTPCSQSRCANRTALHPVYQFLKDDANVKLFFGFTNKKRDSPRRKNASCHVIDLLRHLLRFPIAISPPRNTYPLFGIKH